MHRIDTATADPDANGTGKAGFRDGTPPGSAATRLNAKWFNAAQEEIANTITSGSKTLDAADKTQMATLLNQRDCINAARAGLSEVIILRNDNAGARDIRAVGVGPTWGKDRFDTIVCVGDEGYIGVSLDNGQSFADKTGTPNAGTRYNAVAYNPAGGGEGAWVIGGFDLQYSFDSGTSWARCAIPSGTNVETLSTGAGTPAWIVQDLIFANGVFVLLSGPTTQEIYTSIDGITWTLRASLGVAWKSVAWNGTVFCACSITGEIATSPTGTVWTLKADTIPAGTICALGGTFVMMNNTVLDQHIYTSVDHGVSWVTGNLITSEGHGAYSLIAAFGFLIALVQMTAAPYYRRYYITRDPRDRWYQCGNKAWSHGSEGGSGGSITSNIPHSMSPRAGDRHLYQAGDGWLVRTGGVAPMIDVGF